MVSILSSVVDAVLFSAAGEEISEFCRFFSPTAASAAAAAAACSSANRLTGFVALWLERNERADIIIVLRY